MVGVESGVCCWVVFLVDFGLSWQIQHSSVVFGGSGAFQWFPACSGASSVCCCLLVGVDREYPCLVQCELFPFQDKDNLILDRYKTCLVEKQFFGYKFWLFPIQILFGFFWLFGYINWLSLIHDKDNLTPL